MRVDRHLRYLAARAARPKAQTATAANEKVALSDLLYFRPEVMLD